MQLISPQGPVYQAGTLSGNPLTLAAGVSTLKFILNNKNFYKKLDELAKTLEEGLLYALKDFNIKVNRVGSMISFFFNGSSVDTYEKVISSDVNMYKKLFKYFLSYGILLPPSPFESLFISYAHTNEDIQQTIDIAMKFSKNLKEGKV